jgi:GntR family transcriptional regulator, rspAB operon transcriptional repressor
VALLRDKIYQIIRDAILQCEYRPGEEVREQILAARYHVSRSPVRDSLLRLEREGLVTVLPRRGYRVRPISIPDIENLFELRLLIEPACAAAAARLDDLKLQVLSQFKSFAEKKADLGFLDRALLFHGTVADLSVNRRLAVVALELAEQSARLKRASGFLIAEEMRMASREHDEIIEAIQAHDAETAAQLSHKHVASAHARTVATTARSSIAQTGSDQRFARMPAPRHLATTKKQSGD